MVDPLEVMIAYLKIELAASVGERVAGKHRFGDAWQIGDKAIVVHQDGGDPDLYAAVSNVRLELRFYGASTPEIATLWGLTVALTRTSERESVAISGGATALLQSFTQASGLSLLYDPDLACDFGMAFFDVIVSEEAVIA